MLLNTIIFEFINIVLDILVGYTIGFLIPALVG
jgi:hypothetical protein